MEESNNMELLRLLADESAAEAKKRDAEEDEKAATSKKRDAEEEENVATEEETAAEAKKRAATSKKRDAEEEENVATAKKRAAEGTLKKIKADIVKMEHKKKQDDVITRLKIIQSPCPSQAF